MRKLWRIAILLALVTTACRIEANLDLVIEEDGSGTYTSEVGFDEEVQQALSVFGDTDELLGALDFGVPGASTSERVEGDMTYSVVTSPFSDASELTQIILDNVEGENPFDRFEIDVTDDGATVDALGRLPEGFAGALGAAPDLGETLDAAIAVKITMPGRIVSSNADRTVGDNQLVWDLGFSDTEVVIEAESTFKEDGFPFWIIILVILVAAALAGWWFWSKRQEQSAIASIEAAQAEM